MKRYLIKAHIVGTIEFSRMEEMAKNLKGIYGNISFSVTAEGKETVMYGYFNGEEIDGVTYDVPIYDDTDFGYYEVILIGEAI